MGLFANPAVRSAAMQAEVDVQMCGVAAGPEHGEEMAAGGGPDGGEEGAAAGASWSHNPDQRGSAMRVRVGFVEVKLSRANSYLPPIWILI